MAIGFWGQPLVPKKFRYGGITGGWRGDIPRGQTFILVLIILVARIAATLLEEKFGSARFGPRRKHVKTYINLLLKDGAFAFRVMCFAIVLAQLFIMPAEVSPFVSLACLPLILTYALLQMAYFGGMVLDQAEYDAKMQDATA